MLDPMESNMAPWLTGMEISRTGFDQNVLSNLLSMDLHLDELILRSDKIGNETKPLTISEPWSKTLIQAQQVTIYAKDMNIIIPSDLKFAWVKIGMFAERRLVLYYDKPEVLLGGRAIVMLQYSQTNLGNVDLLWRPTAQRLGLSIIKRDWESGGKAMQTVCLSKGSLEDERFLRASCICRACMTCLAYYDML